MDCDHNARRRSATTQGSLISRKDGEAVLEMGGGFACIYVVVHGIASESWCVAGNLGVKVRATSYAQLAW